LLLNNATNALAVLLCVEQKVFQSLSECFNIDMSGTRSSAGRLCRYICGQNYRIGT